MVSALTYNGSLSFILISSLFSLSFLTPFLAFVIGGSEEGLRRYELRLLQSSKLGKRRAVEGHRVLNCDLGYTCMSCLGVAGGDLLGDPFAVTICRT